MTGTFYRGFRISHENPPIPVRQFDYVASDDNQDGLMVANGRTEEECRADVDRHLEEVEDEAESLRERDDLTDREKFRLQFLDMQLERGKQDA